jgi:hypothetical protein
LTTLHHDDGCLLKLPRHFQGDARVGEQQKVLFMPPLPGALCRNCRISTQSLFQPLLHSLIPAMRHPAR